MHLTLLSGDSSMETRLILSVSYYPSRSHDTYAPRCVGTMAIHRAWRDGDTGDTLMQWYVMVYDSREGRMGFAEAVPGWGDGQRVVWSGRGGRGECNGGGGTGGLDNGGWWWGGEVHVGMCPSAELRSQYCLRIDGVYIWYVLYMPTRCVMHYRYLSTMKTMLIIVINFIPVVQSSYSRFPVVSHSSPIHPPVIIQSFKRVHNLK